MNGRWWSATKIVNVCALVAGCTAVGAPPLPDVSDPLPLDRGTVLDLSGHMDIGEGLLPFQLHLTVVSEGASEGVIEIPGAGIDGSATAKMGRTRFVLVARYGEDGCRGTLTFEGRRQLADSEYTGPVTVEDCTGTVSGSARLAWRPVH
ncbi:MAG: hypothetical protein OEZ65_14720 [Gemmatimonadota bacterium]|nr:hypothetical protein [Gemmatimonadota bacterium]